MPHNLFLHSALVQSRSIDRTKSSKIREANFYFGIEASLALLASFFINAAVLCVFAAGFFSPTCAINNQALVTVNGTAICSDIGLEEAGDALTGLLSK